jgi:predicted CXXCH cytochrome family protein
VRIKFLKILLIVSLSLLMFYSGYSQTSIISSKHNLSTTGTGTIKATSETQVCVFCHTPHSKQVTSQLWNHQPTAATYTLYSSDYLTSKSYPASTQPGTKSKLCMACHDGTIAIGAVYNTTGSGSAGSIAMASGVTTLPSGQSTNVGTSLVNDHPVGFGYDPAKDPELVSRTWPWKTAIKLDPDASTGKVECTSCHEPHHNANGKFLQISNANAALCIFCHNKTNWTASIHKTSTQSYTPSGSTATTIGEWACRNCHQSHNGQGVPYLLDLAEESTCYQTSCHGSTTPGVNTKDIQTQANKTYKHPTNTVSAKHKNPDNSTSLNVPNRHAECYDCHNGHQAKDGLHTLKSNVISNVLTGVAGIIPGTAGIWTQPTTFTVANPVTQENQICFRCHSYNAFGTAVNGVTTIVGPSGINITDQAMEYNVANKSVHPVQYALNNQTGSGTPKLLATAQMATAWNSVGTQTMYCTDCHGNDQLTSATVPQGPHGSARKFMLRGTAALPSAQYWPTNAGGTNLWTLRDVSSNTNSWSTNLFCVGCHPIYTGSTWQNNAHSEHATRSVTIGGKAYTGIPCVSCHIAVPHGAKRSRLITYNSDVAPYAYRDGTINVNIVWGFKKAASRTGYSKSNCYSTQSGCTTHTAITGADP